MSVPPAIPFLQWLNVMPSIDNAIQQGLGVVGAVVGQPMNVFRLSGATNGCIISGEPTLANFPANIRRITQKVAIEGEIFSLICMVSNCNNLPLQLQDVMVEYGYEAQTGGIYVFSQHRPMAETLWMRAESLVQITRPTPPAGNPQQQPTEGTSFIDAYGGTMNASDEVLTLTGGMYSFESESPSGSVSPASIPCQLAQINRVQKDRALGTPTDQPAQRYLIYCPDLPGEQLQELDRIKFPNADSYQVDSVYPGITGMTGYFIIAMKRASS
jgi:hypothetical protein